MPQKTNLNISPYYDDYNKDDNFYKILFKPGYPVQARELTGLQSLLQNQVESFGKHVFKEGSMVIPGGIEYDPTYFSAKINEALILVMNQQKELKQVQLLHLITLPKLDVHYTTVQRYHL